MGDGLVPSLGSRFGQQPVLQAEQVGRIQVGGIVGVNPKVGQAVLPAPVQVLLVLGQSGFQGEPGVVLALLNDVGVGFDVGELQ